ncbi:hypothetical protein SAMN04488564_116102 [Lentzea waywayandensis]|uniref:Secreted protein n=1 Tax=Lentzea waywayandensis TaxID=84724 RepID=A0A1I6FGG5_9PSEU|nr:hypothetical protein [Lentzea waywayandensis]SFR28994.1 hypothetical protein SAMN04488564_116102 [Lentzea waywayandensis]
MKSTIAVLLGLLLALTACGSKEQPAGAQKDEKGDMLKFAQCMRNNGVDIPDPQTSEDGAGIAIQAPGDGAPIDEEKMKTAHEACKEHLPNGGEMKPPSPEEQDKARQQAKCMRDKGYNWPDPKFEGGGTAEVQELPDLEDDKVKQDMKDCGMGEFTISRPVG